MSLGTSEEVDSEDDKTETVIESLHINEQNATDRENVKNNLEIHEDFAKYNNDEHNVQEGFFENDDDWISDESIDEDINKEKGEGSGTDVDEIEDVSNYVSEFQV